jgi:polyhydroxyalkanoate synthesis repressor PhaR
MNPAADPCEIKKYPNRRFYDVTHSRHVTLNELHDFVRSGRHIRVTDSKTGADITNVVLTQIILEHDPPKLDLFPPGLLHQAIQANQQMVRQFIEQYFAQALDAFARSRKHFEDFLQRSGYSALAPAAPFDWVRMLFPGMTGSSNGTPAAPTQDAAIEALKQQIRQMGEELSALRAVSDKPRRAKTQTKRGRPSS